MKRKTVISQDSAYRYQLWRSTGVMDENCVTAHDYVVFIGLNPSTADEIADDATVRRCVGFARRWGYTQLCLVNLFAFRATNPKHLVNTKAPIGDENDKHLTEVIENATLIVPCWGSDGELLGRNRVVSEMLNGKNAMCFGYTKTKSPKHPLYLRNDSELIKFQEKPNE